MEPWRRSAFLRVMKTNLATAARYLPEGAESLSLTEVRRRAKLRRESAIRKGKMQARS